MTISAPVNSTQQYSETDVIEQILSGNKALFEILIRRYNPFLYKVWQGLRLQPPGHRRPDAGDICQHLCEPQKIRRSLFF